jgi:hypothetical protein
MEKGPPARLNAFLLYVCILLFYFFTTHEINKFGVEQVIAK